MVNLIPMVPNITKRNCHIIQSTVGINLWGMASRIISTVLVLLKYFCGLARSLSRLTANNYGCFSEFSGARKRSLPQILKVFIIEFAVNCSLNLFSFLLSFPEI